MLSILCELSVAEELGYVESDPYYLFQGYRIIYRAAPDHLLIVTVLHGSRDLAGQEKKPWGEK
ncbi:MAG: hypothetical protein OEW08_11590 [Gammaproteobacteria bacterium]|nr:hypothetical protein [Gammaproteobacteria bacterium]